MSEWPTKIGDNQFSTARLDPDAPMTFKVTTWSNLSSKTTTVSIDGFDSEGKRSSVRFAQIPVDHYGSVVSERAHLQDLVDDFNAALADNWHAMVMLARTQCAEYYAKKASEYAALSADAAAGVFA